jgi:hypothetical protein
MIRSRYIRAFDKVAEARFFLQHAAASGGEQPLFRYYLSAVISAGRSISLVLQKDLRPHYDAEFDDWWARQKSLLDQTRFREIVDTRNVLQKEGNKLPSAMIRLEVDHESIKCLDVEFDLSIGPHFATSMTFLMHEGKGIDVEIPDDLTEEERDAALVSAADRAVVPVMKSLVPLDVSRAHFLGYVVSPKGNPMSVAAAVAYFEAYLDEMETVLEAAERQFPLEEDSRLGLRRARGV